MISPELQFDPFDLSQDEVSSTESSAMQAPAPKAALKQQVAERLAAHRSKRIRGSDTNLISIPGPDFDLHRTGDQVSSPASMPSAKPGSKSGVKPGRSRVNRIAAAVAERYAHSTTYREFLAAEAERAIAEANATAEVAARNAEAVTAVQQQLLAELDLWDGPIPLHSAPEAASMLQSSQPHSGEWAAPECPSGTLNTALLPVASGLTVRLHEDVGLRLPEVRITSASDVHEDEVHALNQLDDEIAFRHTPVFEEQSRPIAIPANLIEFPRQLVAARRSRARLAEGPLREEADAAPAAAQLRIFEVDATQFSTAAAVEPAASLPEWSTIHLDAIPKDTSGAPLSELTSAESGSVASSAPDAGSHIQTQMYVPLQVAPLGQRLMAAAVDACLLGFALLAAISAFAYCVKSLPTPPVAAVGSAATLLVLFVLYHMLFFTFACATPGMRYARIGLCLFSDDNPTRAEMRRRVWFILLAACPLGLGILWSLLDEDTLGWHDRLSRIYQRSY